ncbi:hypothetical protein MesoLjLa_63160 (plasmid) [Mesorhizobium sp. L-2-11]|nr:hypothetical protein MesoLjLa_63160 [Mesorhizobium sp. L-2-11]
MTDMEQPDAFQRVAGRAGFRTVDLLDLLALLDRVSAPITANVRLSGGATRTLTLERPVPIPQIRKFKPELVAEVDRHCDREIADIFNEGGLQTWEGKPFNPKKIAFIRA